MGELVEALITSDSEANQWTCSAWDPRTGTSVMTYKGGEAAASHCLSMVTNNFLVTANNTKPLIHIWPTNSQEQISGVRLVSPGKVNALAVSSDGNFLIAGIQENIYIWQICSGKLLNVISRHFQAITTIKFTDDNSHFVSAGHDGTVLVWNLTKTASGEQQPLYNLNDHALPVTDIHIGRGGLRAILCTVSLDRSCRFYNLITGELLLNLVHDEGLTSICINILENDAFIGTVSGIIYQYNLNNPPRIKEYHMQENDYNNKFLGHNSNSVTCLDLSLDGKMLASGGKDNNVYLWDIASKQVLRVISHRGPITNIKFILCGRNTFNAEINFNLIISNLKRMKDNEESSIQDVIEVFIPDVAVDNEIIEDFCQEFTQSDSLSTVSKSGDQSEELKALKEENERLKKINRSLYNFSVNKILCNESEIDQH
ncbi:WD repeat-containing protein 18 [Condylostylus longicornis]|uniref:WD repeat-containing protein 18 n=1 Tax=Condylostylus longicornis TaxID=2530218 RepID=UPI00244DBC57|nr:WD repeat-containing protein 18 [Condylostylus longicornis]